MLESSSVELLTLVRVIQKEVRGTRAKENVARKARKRSARLERCLNESPVALFMNLRRVAFEVRQAISLKTNRCVM